MYKYQKETLNYLEELREKLEKLTDNRMSIEIGLVKGEYLNISETEYYEETRDLFFCINDSHGTFEAVGDFESSYGVDEDDVIRLNRNLFIQLNEFIDRIYKNKKEREEFHEKLNKELEALNKSL